MPDTNFFTGTGATGVAIEDAVSVGAQAGAIWDYIWGGGVAGIANYRNPGDVHSYRWMNTQTAAQRLQQADTFLSHNCARGSELATMLSRISVFPNTQMRDLILGATSMTRGEFITVIANHYNLEPALVAAIILTEQRDQSEAEDLVDWISAYHQDRRSTSIGLGQMTLTTCRNNNLLDRIFNASMFSPFRFAPSFLGRLLADDAINIEATARYIRLVANAGAEVSQSQTNSLHTNDSRCPNPSSGVYQNSALRDLSILSQNSTQWISLGDSSLPAAVPAVFKQRNGTLVTPPSTEDWRLRYQGQYYVRLIGFEYTSCPFDPQMLSNGITYFNEDPATPGEYFVDLVSTGAWGLWVSIAFDDCIRSTHI